MRFVFASDSFKGTLTSKRTAQLLTEAAHAVFPECETVSLTVADGGEGTADAVIAACGGEKIYVDVHDPLMNPIRTYYGRTDHNTAIIEMALASGLVLVPLKKRNPLVTTSFGTGELVRHAIKAGNRKIVIAIGGSATNDGGMGFAAALGVSFTDKDGNELGGRGADLEKVVDIDMTGVMPEINDVSFTVMCDVNNPLCGENGATFTYGRQKGADDNALKRLEAGMQHYRDIIRSKFQTDPDAIPGAGAAGGLGAALKIFFDAKMQSGIETVIDMTGFDEVIRDADLIVTGEGCLDFQSLNGKVVQGIGKRALKQGIPAVALCGCTGEGYEQIFDHGISKVWTTMPEGMELSKAMQRAEELYLQRAIQMFEHLKGNA
ncbi:MAG: glycerate kinase [Lachnospiraceae bacterium]|nr:glycerate kinase [Lachnospiraceae bacterium]